MSDYELNNKGTIECKLGEKFKIEGKTAVHIEGHLSYPEDAFTLVNQRKKKSKNMGARPPTVYVLEALMSGTFEIEYQRLEAPFDDNPGEVIDADLYTVIVCSSD